MVGQNSVESLYPLISVLVLIVLPAWTVSNVWSYAKDPVGFDGYPSALSASAPNYPKSFLGRGHDAADHIVSRRKNYGYH